MMQPKRTKYRKQQKGRNTGLALTGNKVSFGEFGLKVAHRYTTTLLVSVSIEYISISSYTGRKA